MLEIIISNSNIYNLCSLLLKKKLSKNITNTYLMNEHDLFIKLFFITKYILYFLNIFIPIKIIFIQIIPNDIINVLNFFKYSFIKFKIINNNKLLYSIIQSIKKYNNIEINYYPENNNILKKFISIYSNSLTDDQVKFFNYITELHLDNINNKYFLKGLHNLINICANSLCNIFFIYLNTISNNSSVILPTTSMFPDENIIKFTILCILDFLFCLNVILFCCIPEISSGIL